MNDLAETKPTDDAEIARKAAEYMVYRRPMLAFRDDGMNNYLNRALRYMSTPLGTLKEAHQGKLVSYIVGAREARGDK